MVCGLGFEETTDLFRCRAYLIEADNARDCVFDTCFFHEDRGYEAFLSHYVL